MAYNRKDYSIEEAIKSLGKDIDNMSKDMLERARAVIPAVATQTHGLIIEKANERLKSRRSTYVDAVQIKQIASSADNEIWAVTLDKSAGWIEDGMPAGERIDMILNGGKPAKTAKDGSQYKIIPFKHNKPRGKNSAAEQRLANYVKGQLKAQGLDGIITKDGKPVIGKVASVKITDPNQPVGKGNRPILTGLTIYQRSVQNKSGTTSIKKDVMTFRVISSKQKGTGVWEWREQDGVHIFKDVEKEVDRIFDEAIKGLIEGME